MRAVARLILVLFHVGGGPVGSEGLFPLLRPISSACLYRWPKTRTSPVLNAVFVPQMRVFDVELTHRLVDANVGGSGYISLTDALIDIFDSSENERAM